VAATSSLAALNLGFLTILHDVNGYAGGYLVTNSWGRPLEFRVSTVVQPNRVQQILYGSTLQSYVCADLIGKALVEKSSLVPKYILTDCEAVVDLRLSVDIPVVWLAAADDPLAEDLVEEGTCVRPAADGHGPILCHPRFPRDVAVVRDWLEQLDGSLDLTEPFDRIREAMSEARKMGVTSRV
jgi:hypothetical protein